MNRKDTFSRPLTGHHLRTRDPDAPEGSIPLRANEPSRCPPGLCFIYLFVWEAELGLGLCPRD